jgi:transposase-like protein
MDSNSTTPTATELFAGEAWFDPIEAGLRDRVRGFIEEMVKRELAAALGRERYARSAGGKGYRNGTRERQLTGSFGAVAISVPRARLSAEAGAGRGNGAARCCPATRG